jgi:murein DD-endopeptidase MepM/ murein hydrolase activator NlpD
MEGDIGKVVDFEENDRLFSFDFTASNTELSADILGDTTLFSEWVDSKLLLHEAKYFNDLAEPRRLHLGTDIWGPAGTSVYAFSDATIHSFAFNDNFGDYGATIILHHQIANNSFYVLYGHLSLSSLWGLEEGLPIAKGVKFAEFGNAEDNGHWPPHLHFQVMNDIQGFKGDYPGVCQYSKRDEYLKNCPDPAFILDNTFKTTSF